MRKKPSAVNASAVASGRLRYPSITLGPRTCTSPMVSAPGASSVPSSSRSAHLDAVQRGATDPARRSPVDAGRGDHQRLGHAVALDRALAGEARRAARARPPAARAEPDTSSRAAASARGDPRVGLGGVGEPVVHRGHGKQHRRSARPARTRRPPGENPPRCQERAAAAHRAERAQHQPVDVKQRQRVAHDVGGRPRPGRRQRVEVGGDRAPRQHGALRRPGGARRVDDQRRCVGGGFGRQRCAGSTRGGVDRDPAHAVEAGRQLGCPAGQHGRGRGVRQDVRELAVAGLGVDRDRRHAGDQRRRSPPRRSRAGSRRTRPRARSPASRAARPRTAADQLRVGVRALGYPQCGSVRRMPEVRETA